MNKLKLITKEQQNQIHENHNIYEKTWLKSKCTRCSPERTFIFKCSCWGYEGWNKRERNKLGKQHMLSGRIIRSYRFPSKLGHALGVTRKLVRRYITRKTKQSQIISDQRWLNFFSVKISVRFYQERKMWRKYETKANRKEFFLTTYIICISNSNLRIQISK